MNEQARVVAHEAFYGSATCLSAAAMRADGPVNRMLQALEDTGCLAEPVGREDFRNMMAADYALTLTYVPTQAQPWRIEVIKSRFSGFSKHSFRQLRDMIALVEKMLDAKGNWNGR